MMMFWIVFVFTMTRDTKDTLIVTNCGAEAIAFLKVSILFAFVTYLLYNSIAPGLRCGAGGCGIHVDLCEIG